MSDEYTPCAWCGAAAMGFASPDPGWVAESESCGAEGHGFSFRPDASMFDAWLAAHDREVAERAWDEGYGHGAGRGPKTGYKNNPYRSGESE